MFDCQKIIYESGALPIPSLGDWVFMRGAYFALVGDRANSLDYIHYDKLCLMANAEVRQVREREREREREKEKEREREREGDEQDVCEVVTHI